VARQIHTRETGFLNGNQNAGAATGLRNSVVVERLGPMSLRLSRNVNFQGRFGNETITVQDLDLDDEPVLDPPRLSKREVQAI